MSKYTQYTDEVKSIREDTGYGSDRIAQMLSSKYPNDDIVVSTLGRWIRKNDIISPSIVDESMHRHNLNPSDN